MKQNILNLNLLINNLVGKIEKEHSLFFDGQNGPKMTKHNHLPHKVLRWFTNKFTHYLQWNKVKEYEMHLNSIWVNHHV